MRGDDRVVARLSGAPGQDPEELVFRYHPS